MCEALHNFSLADSALAEIDSTINDNLKGVFIRALAEARARNPGTELAKYIESCTTVQVSDPDDSPLDR